MLRRSAECGGGRALVATRARSRDRAVYDGGGGWVAAATLATQHTVGQATWGYGYWVWLGEAELPGLGEGEDPGQA